MLDDVNLWEALFGFIVFFFTFLCCSGMEKMKGDLRSGSGRSRSRYRIFRSKNIMAELICISFIAFIMFGIKFILELKETYPEFLIGGIIILTVLIILIIWRRSVRKRRIKAIFLCRNFCNCFFLFGYWICVYRF